jgi:hypothetical protein
VGEEGTNASAAASSDFDECGDDVEPLGGAILTVAVVSRVLSRGGERRGTGSEVDASSHVVVERR